MQRQQQAKINSNEWFDERDRLITTEFTRRLNSTGRCGSDGDRPSNFADELLVINSVKHRVKSGGRRTRRRIFLPATIPEMQTTSPFACCSKNQHDVSCFVYINKSQACVYHEDAAKIIMFNRKIIVLH